MRKTIACAVAASILALAPALSAQAVPASPPMASQKGAADQARAASAQGQPPVVLVATGPAKRAPSPEARDAAGAAPAAPPPAESPARVPDTPQG